MSERTTALSVASHRRYVLSVVVNALRNVFDNQYDRDRQLVDLKITAQYPLAAVDYPCVVVTYEPQVVRNAGVGHEEWFTDSNNILRKWHHSRFEGTINFEILALTTIDRDILSDAVTEVIRFGRLDAALLDFFTTLYGDPNAQYALVFNQIQFNADEVTFGGDSASLATWSPEDLMQYTSTLTCEVHGGYYNVNPTDVWGYVTRVVTVPYNSFDEVVIDLDTNFSNPFQYVDISTAQGAGSPSTAEG